MPLRWQEVAIPLTLVTLLLALKHLPATAGLPLGRLAGTVAFGYAIFLALRLVQGTDAVSIDGWDQLRASPVEWFGALLFVLLAGLFLTMVLMAGDVHFSFRQVALAMAFSLTFALIAGGIILASLASRTRWNGRVIEHRSALGGETRLDWADVVGIATRWRGMTIWTRDGRAIRFSPYQSGAAQLARFAATRILRNAQTAGAVVVS